MAARMAARAPRARAGASRAGRAARRAAPRAMAAAVGGDGESGSGGGGGGERPLFPLFRQTVSFVEPRTRTRVVLVGCMHFNPHSVALATREIAERGERGALGAVVLEQCERRWRRAQERADPNASAWKRLLLTNEMQAAADACEKYGARLVLGDQGIEELGGALKAEAKRTVADLLSPHEGGWVRVARDLTEGAEESFFSSGADGLRATDLLDPRLVLTAPVTLIRYPAALLLKAPKTAAFVLGWFGALALAPAWVPAFSDSMPSGVGAEALVLALEVAQILLVSRVGMTALLRKRNEILAAKIHEACVAEAQAVEGAAGGGGDGGSERTVVAVLGAAHCNGVHAILARGEGDGA